MRWRKNGRRHWSSGGRKSALKGGGQRFIAQGTEEWHEGAVGLARAARTGGAWCCQRLPDVTLTRREQGSRVADGGPARSNSVFLFLLLLLFSN
jgi:hypothetical protein